MRRPVDRFALFVAAAALAIRIDRPGARRNARLPSCSPLSVRHSPRRQCSWSPGSRATRRRRRRAASRVALDWLHLAGGSLWIGGLRRPARPLALASPAASRVAGPRRRRAALLEHRARLGARPDRLRHRCSGHPPADPRRRSGRRRTAQAILWKIGLLAAALALGGSQPAADEEPAPRRPEDGERAAVVLLRSLVGGEGVLVVAAVFAAAVLSSLPPPSKALAAVGGASAHVGPGRVTPDGDEGRLHVRIPASRRTRRRCRTRSPSTITRGGKPVRGAEVVVDVCDAGHGDGKAGVQADRDGAGHLRARGAGARHGRALGARRST